MRLQTLLPLATAATSASMVARRGGDGAVPAALPRLTSVQYSGSGCPSGAPGVERSGGFGDARFRLTAFAVTSAAAPGDRTAQCAVHLRAAGASAGWQAAVAAVDVRGRLVLDPGAGLDYFVTTFWSQNAGDTATVRGTIDNNEGSRFDDIVTVRATMPSSNIAWSPCTDASGDIGILNINFRTALKVNDESYGTFGDPTETVSYVWRRC